MQNIGSFQSPSQQNIFVWKNKVVMLKVHVKNEMLPETARLRGEVHLGAEVTPRRNQRTGAPASNAPVTYERCEKQCETCLRFGRLETIKSWRARICDDRSVVLALADGLGRFRRRYELTERVVQLGGAIYGVLTLCNECMRI